MGKDRAGWAREVCCILRVLGHWCRVFSKQGWDGGKEDTVRLTVEGRWGRPECTMMCCWPRVEEGSRSL